MGEGPACNTRDGAACSMGEKAACTTARDFIQYGEEAACSTGKGAGSTTWGGGLPAVWGSSIVAVGRSQMWRLGKELTKIGNVDVIGCVRMEAENTQRKNTEILKEVHKRRGDMDIVLVGGPTNSLVRHGKEGSGGFRGE
jgi:hypothetical protein